MSDIKITLHHPQAVPPRVEVTVTEKSGFRSHYHASYDSTRGEWRFRKGWTDDTGKPRIDDYAVMHRTDLEGYVAMLQAVLEADKATFKRK